MSEVIFYYFLLLVQYGDCLEIESISAPSSFSITNSEVKVKMPIKKDSYLSNTYK